MSNRLDLPPELLSLVEKREQEDRRKRDAEAQSAADREPSDRKTPDVERRTGKDRRANES